MDIFCFTYKWNWMRVAFFLQCNTSQISPFLLHISNIYITIESSLLQYYIILKVEYYLTQTKLLFSRKF